MMGRCLTLSLVLAAPCAAQDTAPSAPPRPSAVVGEVTLIDVTARRLEIRNDAGETATVTFDEKTTWLKALPGAKDLAQAQPATAADAATGDRVLARGARSGEPPVLTARQIVVMARGDIADKQERERAEWRRRGVAGVVQSIDTEAKRVTLRVASFGGGEPMVVSTTERPAAFRRYAPDSARFRDATPGTFEQIQIGDQLRALGERADTVFVAEQVVSGGFQTVVGQVTEVGGGRFQLKPEAGGEDIGVTLSDETVLRRVPAEMASRLSERAGGGGGAGSGGPRRPPEGPAPAGGEGDGGGRPRSGAGDFIDRIPTMAAAELKPGDRVLVSSPQGKDPRQVTAIAVVAGLEAFVPRERPGRGGADTNLGLPPGILDMAAGLP